MSMTELMNAFPNGVYLSFGNTGPFTPIEPLALSLSQSPLFADAQRRERDAAEQARAREAAEKVRAAHVFGAQAPSSPAQAPAPTVPPPLSYASNCLLADADRRRKEAAQSAT